MNIIKRQILRSMHLLPFKLYRAMAPANPICVFYHMISNTTSPHVKYIYTPKTVDTFRAEVDFFLKHYNPISLAELIKCTRSDTTPPKNSILITFDDGFREMHDLVMPILMEKGVPVTFFIATSALDNKNLLYRHKASLVADRLKSDISNTGTIKNLLNISNEDTDIIDAIMAVDYSNRDIIDEAAVKLELNISDYLREHRPYLTSDHIRSMIKAGFAIGSHSVDHPPYSSIPINEQLDQTRESTIQLKKNFGLDYGAFAFPFNDHGVSLAFFDTIRNENILDATFGTSGLRTEAVSGHYQRIGMDTLPAETMLAKEYAQASTRKMTFSNTIHRE